MTVAPSASICSDGIVPGVATRYSRDFEEAVARRDTSRLFRLAGFGPDLADDGPALLRRAVESELSDARASGSEAHVDLTVLVMMSGADPRKAGDGASTLEVARAAGHWFAVLVMEAWGHHPADAGPAAPPPDGAAVKALAREQFRHLHELLAGRNLHAEIEGQSLLSEALENETSYWQQDGVVHLDGSAMLLALGADPQRRLPVDPFISAHQRAINVGGEQSPVVKFYEHWMKRRH